MIMKNAESRLILRTIFLLLVVSCPASSSLTRRRTLIPSVKTKVETLGELLKQRVQTLKRASNHQVELVFLVDSSASVGADNFLNELKFVRKLLADFTVVANETRVAVITFSSRNRVIRQIDYLSSPSPRQHKCALLEEDLPRIKYTGGGTYTLGAVLEAQKVLTNAREGAAKAVFLITDGYSNGGDPRPAARALRSQGIEIFTFGIRNGNIRELYDMASEPQDRHSFILDSFEEFEALARRALHEDLQSGGYLFQHPEACRSLCQGTSSCCDRQATCACGTHTGYYTCLCNAGYYGTGKVGDCKPCPAGTYHASSGPSDINACLPCPDQNQFSESGSFSVDQCICKKGFHKEGNQCIMTKCPSLQPPEHGYFVKNKCNNVLNAACGITCDTGYRLLGSSIRLCGEDGMWSGDEPKCIMKTCSTLRAPKFGKMVCTDDNPMFETECHFTCDQGYTLVGSKRRTCLAISLWDGLQASCRPISCSSLFPPKNGVISPTKCFTQKAQFGDTCKFSCNEGFALKGPSEKYCRDPGVWSQEDIKVKCLDIEPPTLICPENITIEAHENEKVALVSWLHPTATDNSGVPPSTSVSPAVILPMQIPIGTVQIVYTAEDEAKNKARCYLNITVIDKQPPIIDRCVSPPTFLSKDNKINITWEEPLFSDNSDGPLFIKQSHQPGPFPFGETHVLYEVSDKAGNKNNCTIIINVQEHACKTPADPVHGNTNCYDDENGKYCTLTCDEGYGFAVQPEVNYFCANDGIWMPSDNSLWPDCSAKKMSNSISQFGVLTFHTESFPCDDSFYLNQLEYHMLHKIQNQAQFYCPNDTRCDLTNIIAECEPLQYTVTEESNAVPSKTRRSTERKDHLEKEDHQTKQPYFKTFERHVRQFSKMEPDQHNVGSFMFDDNTNYFSHVSHISSISTDPVSPLHVYMNGVHQSKTDSGGSDDLGFTQYEPSGDGFVQSDMMDSKKPNSMQSINFQMHLTNTFRHESSPDGNKQALLQRGMKTLVNGLATDGKKGELDITLHAYKVSFSTILVDESNSQFVCDLGSIPQGNQCVKCPVGTFYNVLTEKCQSCEKGTYQFDEGQLSCMVCPSYTSTKQEQAKSPTDCKAQCLPGSFSFNGLEMCETCHHGFYQPEYAKSQCLPCPNKTATVKRGSRTVDECSAICPPGSVSKTGLAPCFSCPIGYFQMLDGKSFCYRCPNFAATSNEKSTDVRDCIGFTNYDEPLSKFLEALDTLEINACFFDPCENGATCESHDYSFYCHCLPGYTGMHCENDINECASTPCLNNGTCVDKINKFECNCAPGFSGVICENDIDECALLKPCVNGGECIDQINGFYCKCLEGYQGYFCDVDINECATNPCLNDGKCLDLVAAYSCNCPEGFSGDHCEINIDECESNPCLNNATCQDQINSFKCDCSHGYTGSLCEVDIDECYSSPCLNGGFCIDGQGMFSCICAPSFSGAMCENELTSDFVLHFSSSGIIDHSRLPGPHFNMTQLTLCMWLLTSDKNNYGTPFSYSTNEEANAFTLTDYNGFVIYINGEKVITDVIISDNHWHMICVTWISDGGHWNIYKDGQLEDGGTGLATNSIIQGNGIVVLGQEQDSRGGGFSAAESYIGSITLVNLWNEQLPEDYIVHLATTCDPYKGGVIAWPDFLGGLRGKILVENSVFCQGCQSLIPPDHGSLSITGMMSGALATYSCEPGFKLEGEFQRHCLLDGEWSDDQPFCERITCDFPGYLLHGQIIGHGYNFEDVIEYKCNTGFTIDGNSTRYCQQNGQWSGDAATCKEIFCKHPGEISNGEVVTILSSFHAGDRIEFRCMYGYILEGPHTLTCMEDGIWDQQFPHCQLASCSTPPSLKNGFILNKSETVLAIQNVTYSCFSGYRIVGNSTLHCSRNLKWEGELPQCEPVNCGTPPKITNGIYKMNSTTFNDTVKYFCQNGFKLKGDSETKCTEEGKWTKQPTCEIISCNKPKSIPHGRFLGSNFNYGSQIEYICDPHYKLIGEKIQVCLQNGSWSESLLSCVITTCPAPDDIFNGYTDEKSPWIVGKIIKYKCNSGYVLNIPKAEFICLKSGKWNWTSLPDCLPVECHPPLSIDHGYFIGDVFQFGNYVEYRCNEGYQIEGEPFLKCTENGTWNNSVPNCVKVTCGPVSSIENGMINVDSFKYQSVIQYKCRKGFELQGNFMRICLANGSWSHTEPECSVISCNAPKKLQYGTTNYTSITFGSYINYFCNEGYILIGPTQRKCNDNGEWTENEPICMIINCTALLPISNGFVEVVSLSVNSTAVYECNKGYELFGYKMSTCLKDGTWSNDPPQCNAIQCSFQEKNFTNGKILRGNDLIFGSIIEFECNSGYSLSGNPIIKCLLDKTWDHPIPKCNRISCPKPKSVNNGYYLGDSYKFGDILEFACFSGYEIRGISTQTCLANGTWSPEKVQCDRIKCPKPTSPVHGLMIIQGLHYQDRVVYECENGFKLIGENTHTCQANRKWNYAPPKCKQIQCPTPETPDHGKVKVTTRFTGSKLKYTCDNGYKIIGEEIQECQSDGTWSSQLVKCELILCPEFNDTIQHGIVNINDNRTFNSTVEFTCNEGYKLIGVNQLLCLENGEWNGVAPICSKVFCPTLKGIDHGIIVAKDFAFGSVVEFFCKDGYYIKGKSKIYCLINGEWSANFPVCKPLSCPKIHNIHNGKVIGVKFEVGASIKFVCKTGFILKGEDTLTCQVNGTWQNKKPLCQPIFCNIPEAPMHAIKHTVKNNNKWLFESLIEFDNVTISDSDNHAKDGISYDVEMHIDKVPFGTILHYTCKEGYVTQKYDSLQCIGENEWSNLVPECDVVSCEILMGISNGSISYRNSFKYKDIVDYKCNVGYKLKGNSTRTCLANGNWSGITPICEPMLCPMLTYAVNGRYKIIGNKIGNEAVLECENGHKINGPLSRICTDNGDWSLPEPTCEPVSCPDPPHLQNGTLVIESVLVGGTVTYSCNSGYELIGESVLSCLKTGIWSNASPSCELIICPQLNPVPYSSIESNGWTYGAVSQHVCNSGYELIGNSERVCLHNKTWSGTEPQCRRVMCPKILGIKNGRIFGKDYSVGGIIRYECNDKFALEGLSSRKCQNDHTWTGNDPVCNLKKCPPITDILHGSLSGTNFTIDSVLQFRCDKGFILKGHSILHCMENQQWSHSVPVCQKGQCKSPPIVKHADMLGSSFAIGDSIKYKCKSGFLLEGYDLLFCNETAEWEGILPICKLIICKSPPPVLNARIHFVTSNPSAYAIGSTAFYTCNEGYQLLGDYSLMCENNGEWSGTTPVCMKIACGPPIVIENGNVHVEHQLNYSRAIYQCNPGYLLIGKPVLGCIQEGIWDENSPMCVPLSCGEPPPIRNGKPNTNSYEYLSVVTYFCMPGFHIMNNDTLTCGQNGMWIGRKPRCSPVVCDPPDLSLPYMIIDGNDFTYKSAIFYSCFQGYKLQGNEIRFCQADGKWSGNVPYCIRVKCEELNPPINGMIMVENRKPGSIARFKCNMGYKLIGSDLLHCLDNGHWNNKIPNCTIITCKPPPILDNTIDFGYDEDFSYGDRIAYRCKDGFRPNGNMTIYCQKDRSWSQPRGQCVRISCGRPKANNGAIILGISYLYTDHVMYTCPPGKKAANRAIISCQSNGTWDHEPICTALCIKKCLNGGVCIYPGKCSCPNGYIGDTCQHAVCILPCLNGGTCNGPFSCLCKAGYTGTRCESSVCPFRCLNGGSCVAKQTCACLPGYRGSRCERPICMPPCENGGLCIAPNKCRCHSGFFPPYCRKR